MKANYARSPNVPDAGKANSLRGMASFLPVLLVQSGVFWFVSNGLSRPSAYFMFYVLPTATVFLFLSRLRMFLEHGSLDYAEFDYGHDSFPMARTIPSRFPERIIFCGMNFNFHHEHHLYPQVPSVQLPRLFREVTSKRIDRVSYAETYFGGLKKLWDSLAVDR